MRINSMSGDDFSSSGIILQYLDFDNLPDTNFSCVGKVIGGYYADLETSCQMFHVCTIGQLDEPMDIRFLCLNGTVFDQVRSIQFLLLKSSLSFIGFIIKLSMSPVFIKFSILKQHVVINIFQ